MHMLAPCVIALLYPPDKAGPKRGAAPRLAGLGVIIPRISIDVIQERIVERLERNGKAEQAMF